VRRPITLVAPPAASPTPLVAGASWSPVAASSSPPVTVSVAATLPQESEPLSMTSLSALTPLLSPVGEERVTTNWEEQVVWHPKP